MASLFKPWSWFSSTPRHQAADTLAPEHENNPPHIEDEGEDAEVIDSRQRMANLEATMQDNQDQLGDVQTRMQDVTTDVASVRDLIQRYHEEVQQEFRHLRTSVATNAQLHDATQDPFANDVERQLSAEQQQRSSETLSASPETDHVQPETKTPNRKRRLSSAGLPTEPMEPPTPGGKKKTGPPKKKCATSARDVKGTNEGSEPQGQRQPLQEISDNITLSRPATTSQAKGRTKEALQTDANMPGANPDANQSQRQRQEQR